MALRKRPIAAGIAALFFSSWVSAVGLGEIKLNSALNEPLDAEIRLLNTGELGEAEILAGLASAADFANAGIDRELVHNSLVFRLDIGAAGGPLLRVMSNKPIREPYLDLLVDLQWPSGRLLREYTLLLDLPVFSRESSLERAFQAEGVPQQSTTASVARPRYTAPAAEQAFEESEPAPVASGEEYEVNAGDTLWSIASRLSGSGSVHRKMSAIHQLNPEAFIGGDMNLLRSGQVLRLPDYGQMAAADTSPAEPVSTPAAGEPVMADIAGGEQPEMLAPQLSATSRASDTGEPVETEPSGRLRLSAIDPNTANETDFIGQSATGNNVAGGTGAGQVIRAELSTIQEEMARTQRENAELKDRLANLEEQLSTMQRLIEIDDDGLRAAQLAGADGSAADSGPVSSASTAAPAKPNQQIKSEKGWFDTVSSYLVYAIGILLLLIGGLVFAMLKKRRDSGDSQDEYFPPVSERVTPAPRVVERQVAEVTPQASSIDDIDLKDDDDIFAPAAAAAPAARHISPAARPFDEDLQELVEPSLTEPVPAARAPLQETRPEEIDDLELDLSEFELDDFQAVQSTSTAPLQKVSDPLNLDDEFDFLNDADEGETQLELAQAYIDMGDAAGAREILQEVLEGGSESHKELARSLLAKIS